MKGNGTLRSTHVKYNKLSNEPLKQKTSLTPSFEGTVLSFRIRKAKGEEMKENSRYRGHLSDLLINGGNLFKNYWVTWTNRDYKHRDIIFTSV